MNNDLISRKALKAQAVEVELPFPPYNHRSGEKIVFVYDIDDAPAVDAVEIVRCRDCVYRGIAGDCPMCHDETYDDDGYAEYYTRDNTVDDGFCYMGSKEWPNYENLD